MPDSPWAQSHQLLLPRGNRVLSCPDAASSLAGPLTRKTANPGESLGASPCLGPPWRALWSPSLQFARVTTRWQWLPGLQSLRAKQAPSFPSVRGGQRGAASLASTRREGPVPSAFDTAKAHAQFICPFVTAPLWGGYC